MRTNFILKSLILITYLNSFLISDQIPSNNLSNYTLNRWIVVKDDGLNDDKIQKLVSNPVSYVENALEKRNLDLGGQMDIAIQAYQLFENFSYKSKVVAITNIEVSNSQEIGIAYLDYDMESEIYVNGKLVMSGKKGYEFQFKTKLNKGQNIVIIIGDVTGDRDPSFFAWFYGSQRAEISGIVRDLNGKPVPFAQVFLLSDRLNNANTRADKNGKYEYWIYPNFGEYTISSRNNNYYGYAKPVKTKEYGRYKIDISLKNKSHISGIVYTMDKKTPHPGVTVELVNISNNEVFLATTTSERGKYRFEPPKGQYHLRIFANDKYIYKKDNNNEEVFDFSSNDQQYEADFYIQNQIKGAWDKIGMFDGMLSMAVHVTMLSSDDLLYVGTYNGMTVYDGLTVKTYNYDHGLPNSFITDVYEDSDGYIWIAFGNKGIVKWKSGSVIKHYTEEDGLPSNTINVIRQDKDGNFLIGTSKGLSIFDGKKFDNYDFTDGIGNGFVTDIEVIGNNIWIGTGNYMKAGGRRTHGGGLTLYNGKTFKSFDLSQFSGIDPRTMHINCITEYNGTIWIGAVGGLLKYDGSKFTIYRQSDGLPSNNINDILVDNNGVWICTNGGLANFNNGGFKIITTLDEKSDGLTGLYGTTAISKSRDGIYFIGGAGIRMYDPNSLRTITTYEGMPVPNNWTSGITDLLLDKDGSLWAASLWNGLYKINGEIITKNYNKENSNLPGNGTINLAFAQDGSLWSSHGSNGIARTVNGDVENMTKKLNIPPNTNVRDIAFDKKGTLWLGTNRGIGKYKNDTLTFYSEKDGLITAIGNCDINIGVNGEVIYSNYGYGFSIYDGETFKNYNETNGLVDNRIWDLAVDSKNNIWMATDGSGVQMFDGENFVHHSVGDGVTAGETFSIYVDDFDNIWVGTFGGGVCYYDGKVWNSVDTRDGLLQNLIGSIEGVDGNKYWFGSELGITTYMPKRQVPNVYIEKIKTAKGIFKSLDDFQNRDYNLLEESRITFTLNSNSYNTKKEKQKYIVNTIYNNKKQSKLIKTNEFEFFPEKPGDYEIEFQSIDRDLNYSKTENIVLSIVGPWYTNPPTAIPFWGFILFIFSISGYTTNKYIKQRQFNLHLKEEGQRKDREARQRLEEKNSELVESQKVAEAANEAKSTFLANMSHELRTPLNAIIGYSEMLMEDAEDENEDFIPDLDKINNSGKHLLGLINDILDLSKVESGKMELYIEEFDLPKVMHEIESTIKPLVEKNNNILTIECDANLKTMTADITKIRQIMLNLLSNSSKFTNDGAITIHVSNSVSMDNAIDFIIADTGIGMSAEQVDKVFKPFTQADEKTTRKFGGTGLGLTITKMFAEMMGGDINLTSEEGKGTTFTVTIPLVVVDKKKQNTEVITDVAHDNDYTILVIDDDDNAQDMMKKFLEKQDFSILQAKRGEDGLKLAAEHMPDVITLDVMMPEMDGWEVLAALQGNERTKNIPVIMLTMADEPDIGYSLGATDYLTKPVNWTELSTILSNHQIQSDSQTILIVEDDETTREMLRKSLEKNDFKVRSAVNGKEALEKVSETKPGLIILDLMMPEMDGFEFAERLRENKEWLNIPVVVITAKDLTKEDHSRLKGNVEAIMQKGSYSKNDLMSEIGERIKKLQVRS